MSRATIIDGKSVAAELCAHIASAVKELKVEHRLTPGLAVVIVGNNAASQIYTRNKIKQTEAAGMYSLHRELPENTQEEDLIEEIQSLNDNDSIHGILVQLPLPPHINSERVLETVSPDKDVDGFHPLNAGRLATGRKGLVPCTPLGCRLLLTKALPSINGLHAVVVGRSNIVGKPLSQLLLKDNCTVTLAHSRTRDLKGICKQADILVAAIGKAEMIRGDWIKPNSTVIDVGINRINQSKKGSTIIGDVAFDEAVTVADAISPVPGGVGPMTIACLLNNCVKAACRQNNLPEPDLP